MAAAEDGDPVQVVVEEAYNGVVADFDSDAWDPASALYGIYRLCRIRELMLPIEQPAETLHLKKLNCPRTLEDGPPLESVVQPDTRGQFRSTAGTADRKGKGKGKDKTLRAGGRLIPDMGRTEAMPNWQKGQWWRNVGAENLDVVIREQFHLVSQEIGKIPPGHYVQEAGPVEVFVEGQACGLQRMPVQPRGWVTVDASEVGGPKYLEPVRSARWKVVFSSGSNKGDIVVRDAVSLESDEVAVLVTGTVVEQGGPQEVLKDGIIRMPINFSDGRNSSGKSRQGRGWVTCDASAQGGPTFFEPCPEDIDQAEATWAPNATQAENGPSTLGVEKPAAGGSWDKNRIWRVVNLGPGDNLPVVTRAEGFPPGGNGSRTPPDDMVVRWLGDGDQVEQVGHSKKTRGYMVMPIRFLMGSETGAPAEGEAVEGWVTRRLVEKVRDSAELQHWFEEVRPEGQEARRPRNRKGGDAEVR